MVLISDGDLGCGLRLLWLRSQVRNWSAARLGAWPGGGRGRRDGSRVNDSSAHMPGLMGLEAPVGDDGLALDVVAVGGQENDNGGDVGRRCEVVDQDVLAIHPEL